MHPGRGFAMLARDDLRLALNAVGGSGGASQVMPDGRQPTPGGWNRIQLPVRDLEAVVERLRAAHVTFRNEIVSGMGGKQILVDAPGGIALISSKPIDLCGARRVVYFGTRSRRVVTDPTESW